MTTILSIEELKNYIDLGRNADNDKINPILKQAQDIDLRDYLGMKFYFNVLAHLEASDYQELLDGSTFIHEGVTFAHEGLKSMLAELFLARYLIHLNVNVTPFGATVKQSDNSEPADRNSLKDIAQHHKESAASKWEIINLFIKSKGETFGIYNSSPDTIQTGERRLRFTVIK